MISSTLQYWHHGFHPDVVSEPCRGASSYSRSQSFVEGGWPKSVTCGSFPAPPHSVARLGNGGQQRNKYRHSSVETSWGVQRSQIYMAQNNQLQDEHFSCRSQDEMQMARSWATLDGKRSLRIAYRVQCNGGSIDAGSENEYCDRSEEEPHATCSFRRHGKERDKHKEVPDSPDQDQSGYTIRVSKELMGVFRYVEKVKRARIKELADTLKQTAAACLFFSCVRGIMNPLVEVFKTKPPSWSRLILMLSAFDSFAITYLALKASEPLEKLSVLASDRDKDIMGSIEKGEEHMLALAVELVKLFRRLRNITVCTAVAQFATLMHCILKLNSPKLVDTATKVIGAWLNTPWN